MTAATRSSFSLHVVQGAPPRAARMFRSCLIESSRRASRAGRVGAGVGSRPAPRRPRPLRHRYGVAAAARGRLRPSPTVPRVL